MIVKRSNTEECQRFSLATKGACLQPRDGVIERHHSGTVPFQAGLMRYEEQGGMSYFWWLILQTRISGAVRMVPRVHVFKRIPGYDRVKLKDFGSIGYFPEGERFGAPRQVAWEQKRVICSEWLYTVVLIPKIH